MADRPGFRLANQLHFAQEFTLSHDGRKAHGFGFCEAAEALFVGKGKPGHLDSKFGPRFDEALFSAFWIFPGRCHLELRAR